MTITAPHRGGVAALSLGLALGAAACSGDPDPEKSADPRASSPPPLETTVRPGAVEGALGAPQQSRVVRQVGEVVDGWLDAAYVAGDYPREDFTDAFPGFTSGAAEEAAKDERLMSNADIGPRIDGVVATVRRVRVDLLGVKGEPEGATARVRLVFTTTGELERKVAVTGRLRLTRAGNGWRVFAYDVAKGSRR